jgi:hypothetical protein
MIHASFEMNGLFCVVLQPIGSLLSISYVSIRLSNQAIVVLAGLEQGLVVPWSTASSKQSHIVRYLTFVSYPRFTWSTSDLPSRFILRCIGLKNDRLKRSHGYCTRKGTTGGWGGQYYIADEYIWCTLLLFEYVCYDLGHCKILTVQQHEEHNGSRSGRVYRWRNGVCLPHASGSVLHETDGH